MARKNENIIQKKQMSSNSWRPEMEKSGVMGN
jgi:hypothetical protein